MKIDFGSLAFNINIDGKIGGTPSWGTAIVYQTEDNKIKDDVAKDILIGMIYKKIDCTSAKLSIPLGKGGRVFHGDDDFDTNGAPSIPHLAARFEKTYINGKLIGKPFILLVVKDGYDAHLGRLQLKYSPKISWGEYKNQDFFDEAFNILGLAPDSPFVCYAIDVINQDSLHFRCAYKPKKYKFKDSKEYNNFVNQVISNDETIADSDSDVGNNKSSIPNSRQIIFYGAPGTGKSNKIKRQLENVPKENIFRTTFHPDSDYSTFVGAYKPTKGQRPLYGLNGGLTVRLKNGGEELNEETITYNFVPQAFLNAYMRAYRTKEDVYLIIEEINRGNCAQIFGDLFQLLDRNKIGMSDYTIKADADLKAYLESELGEDSDGIKGGELCLPSNLYIYATMNTSDQSLFPIDSAFKRRWDWEYEPIKYKNTDWKIVISDKEYSKEYSWVSFQKEINDRIFDVTNSEDKMLGDYFVNPSDGIITEKVLLNKILFYLWNDVCKDGEGDIFKINDTQNVSFSELHGVEGRQKLLAMMEYLGIQNVENTDDTDFDDEDSDEISDFDGVYTKRHLKVVFSDGTEFEDNNSTNTLVNTINYIGPDKVYQLNMRVSDLPFVSKQRLSNNRGGYRTSQRELKDGYYLITKLSTDDKVTKIREISKLLNYNLSVSVVEIS